MAPNKKAPAAGGTAAKAAALNAQQVCAPTVDHQAEAEAYCPLCHTRARVLPHGQDEPTDEQCRLGCWVRPDGTGGFRLCGVPWAIKAGLLSALLPEGHELPPPAELALPHRTRDTTVLFLRYAARHPITSDALLRLLVDRLDSLAADPVGTPGFGQRARLRFVFRGVGAAQTIAARHLDELQMLVEALLVFDGVIWTQVWAPERLRWEQPRTQHQASRQPPLDHLLLRDQMDVALGWPRLQPVNLDMGEVARG